MPWRVTNAHRAAVCGLHIAGLSVTKACEIVGVPYVVMRPHLKGWYTKTNPRQRWNDVLLAEVHEAWIDPAQKTATIAARYGVSSSTLWWLAKRHGWAQRHRGPVREPHSVLSMTPSQRTWYRKLAPLIGCRAAALHVHGASK